MEKIRVIVADEQPLFVSGIRAILEGGASCDVVGVTDTLAGLLDMTRTTKPDVALIDARFMSSSNLAEVVRKARIFAPRIAVIMLASIPNERQLFQALRIGASSYYPRTITAEKLVEVVQRANEGAYLFEDDVVFATSSLFAPIAVVRGFTSGNSRQSDGGERPSLEPTSSTLSSRELEVLGYIARGSSNKEIAKTLKISDQTVKNHITSILKKLSVYDRTAAVVSALRHGWITL